MTNDQAAPPIIFPYDFYHFWAAGRVSIENQNPYDLEIILNRMISVGWPSEEVFHGFLHPAWSIWLFTFFGSLPYSKALSLWMLTSIAILVGAFGVSKRLSENLSLSSISSERSKFLRPLLFFSFPPLVATLWNGQTNVFILLGLTLFLVFIRREKTLLAGISLSLLLIKPQLYLAFFLAFFIFVFRRAGIVHRTRLLAGLTGGFLLQCGLSYWLNYRVFEQFFVSMQGMASTSITLPGASLSQNLYTAIPSLSIFPVISIAGIFIAAWLALKTRDDWLTHLLCVSLPVGFLSTPYVWSHSFLPLIFAISFMTSSLLEKFERATLCLYSVYVTLGIFAVIRPHQFDRYMVVVPIVILIWYYRYDRTLLKNSPLDTNSKCQSKRTHHR